MVTVDTYVGTPHYMAPEQIDGTVDGRTDIYALGIVMYEMVTGLVPFDVESVALILDMQLNARPRPPSLQPEGFGMPKKLEKIILRCLEKKPGDRYQNALDVRKALQKLKIRS